MRPDAVFVDGGGVGGGVVDRLRQLKVPVIEVQFGGTPTRSEADQEGVVYADKGAEMWGVCREWLRNGGTIVDDPDLLQQLKDREYEFAIKQGRDAIRLESKKDMKERGLSSPDMADALVLTFAFPVMANKQAGRQGKALEGEQGRASTEYDPFSALDSQDRVGRSEYNPMEYDA